jgi:hypothetical protein
MSMPPHREVTRPQVHPAPRDPKPNRPQAESASGASTRREDRPDFIINGRRYERVVKVTPPGKLRPEPRLLQQGGEQRVAPPPPYDRDPYNFDESDEDSEDGAVPPKVERSMANDFVIPPFWGAVRTTNLHGTPGQEGLERDNSMQNMLSRNTFYSHRSNTVFTGQSAIDALDYERRHGEVYSPHANNDNNQVYQRSPRGLPLNPDQVAKLRTIYRDNKQRFTLRERIEAYLLLRELYTIAHRVLPIHRDWSMVFLLEPKGFDEEPPAYFPTAQMQAIPPLSHNPPPRRNQPPPPERLMDLDDVGLYLIQYHRPGSVNPTNGIAMDYAFRIGRRSVFGYALSRLLALRERDITAIFRRQFAFLAALPH